MIEDLGEICTGCKTKLTLENIGGYRCYCEKCVAVMPELPKDNKGYFLEGEYPNFTWVEA